MPFNSKYPYMRFRDWTTRQDIGTDTVQTSGDANLTGQALLLESYSLHSYQALPMGAGPWDGELRIDVSNDNTNWTNISAQPVSDTGILYYDTWNFAYARASITGSAGNFLINERHLS